MLVLQLAQRNVGQDGVPVLQRHTLPTLSKGRDVVMSKQGRITGRALKHM